MERRRLIGVLLFGIIGMLQSLSHLIFVGISLNLLIRSFQLKFLLMKFLPVTVAGIFLGVCVIFVLRLKNWARIMYLISILAIALITHWTCQFLSTAGYFVYSYSLAITLWKFSKLAFLLLEVVNVVSFVTALVFFKCHKATGRECL